MAHISKQQLDPKQLEELFIQMNNVVANLNKRSVSIFFDELLGTEEKIMLAKRLAAIVMLIEGNSSYRTWQLLKLSPSTAERIRHNYEIGKYQNLEKAIKGNRADYEKFWTTLEVILRAGMPPRNNHRWKSVFK